MIWECPRARMAGDGMVYFKTAERPTTLAFAAFSTKTPMQVACGIEVPQNVRPWLPISTAKLPPADAPLWGLSGHRRPSGLAADDRSL